MRRIVDLYNFTCIWDCKDRLVRNSIVAGLSSTKAYQQCISKGSSLTLSEYIKICQTEDASHRQVQALCPESSDCTDSTSIHKIAQYSQHWNRYSLRGRGAFFSGRYNHRGGPRGAQPWGQNYRHSTETACGFCRSRPHKHRSEFRASGQECFHWGRLGHFSKMCRQNPDNQDSDKTGVKHIMSEVSRLWTEWVHSPLLSHKWPSKGISQMPQDYSQSPLHLQYRHSTHKVTVDISVSGVSSLSD